MKEDQGDFFSKQNYPQEILRKREEFSEEENFQPRGRRKPLPEGIFHRGNSPWERKFQMMKFEGKVLHGGKFVRIPIQNSFFCLKFPLNFTCGDVSEELSKGHFKWGWNCLRDCFVGGGILCGGNSSWVNFSQEKLSIREGACNFKNFKFYRGGISEMISKTIKNSTKNKSIMNERRPRRFFFFPGRIIRRKFCGRGRNFQKREIFNREGGGSPLFIWKTISN